MKYKPFYSKKINLWQRIHKDVRNAVATRGNPARDTMALMVTVQLKTELLRFDLTTLA